MTALTKVEKLETNDFLMNDVTKFQDMSKKLMQTKHYQKIGEDGIFAICIAAKSNGISITDALNGELYYVQGRVGMGYEAMNKYIRMAGHSVIIKHIDEKSCTLIGKRKDSGDTAEITYDMMDAKKAGKNYDKYPKAMLFARCLSMLKRFLFPDVLTKIYEKGELEDIRNEQTEQNEVIDVKPIYIETLNDEQFNEINNLLLNCAPDVSKNLKEYVFKKHNINSISQIPVSEYEKYRDALTLRKNEYQKQVASQKILETQEQMVEEEKEETINVE